jgi:guanylate kinase
MTRGDLFIVSSPSGAGKTTLIRRVLQDPAIGGTLHFLGLPHDAPAARRGNRRSRVSLLRRGGVPEAWRPRAASSSGRPFTGTSTAPRAGRSSRASRIGLDVLLDIDVQGARQVRSKAPEAVKVIVFPPSREVLEARLKARASDAPDVVARRLAVAAAGDGRIRRIRLCDNQRQARARGGRASLDHRGAPRGTRAEARAPRIDPQDLCTLNFTEG